MNSIKRRNHAVVIAVVSLVTALFVAASWAARPERARKLRVVVEQSVREAFPDARIREIEVERRIVRLLEVTVIVDREEHGITLSEDGTILSIDEEIHPDQMPTAVHLALQKVAGGATIKEAERIEIRAELRAVPMEEPQIEYEAKFRTRGKVQEVIVSEDGTTIKTAKTLRFKEDH